MKKIIGLFLIGSFCSLAGHAQISTLEEMKRNPRNRKVPPNRPVFRDSTVLYVVGNRAYRGWDPDLQQLMRAGLMDTSKYNMHFYGDGKSESAVKTIVLFEPRKNN